MENLTQKVSPSLSAAFSWFLIIPPLCVSFFSYSISLRQQYEHVLILRFMIMGFRYFFCYNYRAASILWCAHWHGAWSILWINTAFMGHIE